MRGWAGYNGLRDTTVHDSVLRPASITGPGVESLAFAYDGDNRITQVTNGLNGTQSELMGHDAMNRLLSVTSGAENTRLAALWCAFAEVDQPQLADNCLGVSNVLPSCSALAWLGKQEA
ncbi:MAG: hypothetical protein EPN38_10670 [Rhodanobacteraceae bacterium]|nr:MAG: hypothetical protein EPN38_10670 [Rhodanobacteraceae bacterium]